MGNTIESFLILPVQRIPRYMLLLQAVMHETDSKHPDYALCQQAAEKMEQVRLQEDNAKVAFFFDMIYCRRLEKLSMSVVASTRQKSSGSPSFVILSVKLQD